MLGERIPPVMVGYSAAVLLLIAVVAVWSSRRALDLEVEATSGHACAAATALAAGLDPRDATLDDRLDAVRDGDSDVSRVGVWRPADAPGKLVLVSESGRDARPSGSLVEASEQPWLVTGAHETTLLDVAGAMGCATPVIDATGSRVGVVAVEVDMAGLSAARTSLVRGTVLLIVLSGVGLALLTVAVSRRADALAESMPPPRLPREAPPDPLGRRIDGLTRSLQERSYIRDTFGRYVSHRVAEALIADSEAMALGSDQRTVTVLRGVLAGADALVGRASPADICAVLNDHVAAISSTIDSHGGFLLEWNGDSFAAVFGAPVVTPDHAERGVKCALALRDRVQALMREWDRCGRIPTDGAVKLRMGLHSGDVVVGHVGSSTRTKYVVVGPSIEVAWAIAPQADPILVTEQVKEQLPDGIAVGMAAKVGERTVFPIG
jgi:class 3 adenylate cyclase